MDALYKLLEVIDHHPGANADVLAELTHAHRATVFRRLNELRCGFEVNVESLSEGGYVVSDWGILRRSRVLARVVKLENEDLSIMGVLYLKNS